MATRTKTAFQHLEDLTKERHEAHEKVQILKRRRNEYNEETESMRADLTARRTTHPWEHETDGTTVKPDTETAELVDQVKARMAAPYPKQDELDEAITVFHAADEAAVKFRVDNCHGLIAEAAPDGIADRLVDAWQTIRECSEMYLDGMQRVAKITIDLPGGMDTRDVSFDMRARRWIEISEDAVENPPFDPRLTENGEIKLDKLRSNLGVDDE